MLQTWQDNYSVSGAIKRYAYTIPDHQVSRWMLLIVSDRVDAMESQLADTLKSPWFIVGLTVSAGAAIYLLKERMIAHH
jgi:hypothetical protein